MPRAPSASLQALPLAWPPLKALVVAQGQCDGPRGQLWASGLSSQVSASSMGSGVTLLHLVCSAAAAFLPIHCYIRTFLCNYESTHKG